MVHFRNSRQYVVSHGELLLDAEAEFFLNVGMKGSGQINIHDKKAVADKTPNFFVSESVLHSLFATTSDKSAYQKDIGLGSG